MQETFHNKIKVHFVELVNKIDPDNLADILLLKGALSNEEIKEIFNDRRDIKHINRLLLFRILKKSDSVYYKFLEALEQLNLKYLLPSCNSGELHAATAFLHPPDKSNDNESEEYFSPVSNSGEFHATTVFHQPTDESNGDESEEYLSLSNLTISNSQEKSDLVEEIHPLGIVKNIEPLIVKVKLATNFQPNSNDSKTVYDTKSKNRGQVLIINNRDFGKHHKVREGSEVDVQSLESLFKQMFMKVHIHPDLSCEEMRDVILEFSRFDADRISDICVVVIMSHGERRKEIQVVIDKENNGLPTSWIEEQFSNVNCSLFANKPKVFLYQLCRGAQRAYATTKFLTPENKNEETLEYTQIDSRNESSEHRTESDSGPILSVSRPSDNILLGYATLGGHIAHRDPIFGSWYIRLITEVFMKRAHNTNLIDMLKEVDRKLQKFTSKAYTMQTSSFVSRGFNKDLYFNPGIYQDSSGNTQKMSKNDTS